MTLRPGRIALAVLAAGVLGVMACEVAGWPFLARPMERALSTALHREVQLPSHEGAGTRVRLLGGVSVTAPRLSVANTDWATTPQQPLLAAEEVALRLRYIDLWRTWRGWDSDQPGLRIRSLTAARLELHPERQRDGRANWAFAQATPETPGAPADSPPSPPSPPRGAPSIHFDHLAVQHAEGSVSDLPLQLQARFQASLAASGETRAEATGTYRGNRLRAELQAADALPLVTSDPDAAPVGVQVALDSGRLSLRFDGQVTDLLGSQQLQGSYRVRGPSLAEAGRPFGVTLPTTAAFDLRGRLQHGAGDGGVWHTQVEQAQIGRSRMSGEFHFDARPARPLLTGQLLAQTLWLEDLGPAIGASPQAAGGQERPAPERILPQRDFDLPSLRAMDADVALRFNTLQLAAGDLLRPISPLAGRLRLQDGVLQIRELDAGLAQGRIRGEIELDGRQDVARWRTALTARGVRIETWFPATQAREVPWAAGALAASVQLQGRGRSTADLLASASGNAQLLWTRGSVSHLAVEAAGLDIAQGLARLVRGDEALPVLCGAARLDVKDGLVRPAPAVVDTRDSTVWLEGQLSLADERLDLSAQVAPKDRSPLTLRAPVRLRGTLVQPEISVQGSGLAKRLVPSVLLALVQPLAAVIPLIDVGDREEAQQAAAACARVGGAQASGAKARPAG